MHGACNVGEGRPQANAEEAPAIASHQPAPEATLSDAAAAGGVDSSPVPAPKKTAKKPAKRPVKTAARKRLERAGAAPSPKPVLLSGGNPQIAKADGDAPVQAYIAALPGWKRDVGRRLDALIERTVPHVRKAVRWNSPFYGVEGQGWFLDLHCLTHYIKVAFFRGASLHPVPPVASKLKDVRYVHLHEDDAFDEKLLASWIRQAAALPGADWFAS